MKKIITGIFALALLSNAAYAMSGTVTMGFEQRDYNSTSDENLGDGSKNYIEPYVTGVLSPIKGSPLKLTATYKYREANGKGNDKASRKADNKETYEFYIAYAMKMDKITFTPQFGTVIEDYKKFDDKALGKSQEVIQYRFYPNLNYSVNKDLTLLLVNGYYAPVSKRVRGGETNYDNYKYELSTGFSYKIDGASSVQATLFFAGDSYSTEANSFIDSDKSTPYQKKAGTYTRNTEFRMQYSYTMLDKKLSIRPYVRLPIDRDRKTNISLVDKEGKSRAYSYEEPESRFGIATSYKVTPSFTVFSDIWYDHLKTKYDNSKAQIQAKRKEKPSEHYWAFKAGFTQAF